MKKLVIVFVLNLLFITVYADPPEPPIGKRWILNLKFSDEFNGTALDYSKWYDYHPNWKGRPPGLFLPSQVSVGNGYMSIRGGKMARDTVITNWDGSKSTYNIAAGAVVSRTMNAFFGYYECKFKAAKTSMSTTFWLSSRTSYNGPETCNDKYQLELDIQECIGREGPFAGKYFAHGMNSNSHFWYTGCDGIKQDLRATGVEFENVALASDTFNIYGGWWQDESNVIYYYNNGEGVTSKFYDEIKEKPFDRPMGMNLVSETYPFPWIELPNDEELADSTQNICYYDWVRSYTLMDVNTEFESGKLLINGDFEAGYLTGWRGWGGNPREVSNVDPFEGAFSGHLAETGTMVQNVELNPFTEYTLTASAKAIRGSLILGVRENTGDQRVVDSLKLTNSEYQTFSFNFTTQSETSYNIYFEALTVNDEGYIDDVVLIEDGAATPMFDETIRFSEKPGALANSSELDFLMTYKARANREIHLEIADDSGNVIHEEVYPALGGFGKKILHLTLASELEDQKTYTVRMHIRPLDSVNNDHAFTSDQFTFVAKNPANVSIIIKDERSGTLISGVDVSLNNEARISDSTGAVQFFDVPVDKYLITVSAKGYQSLNEKEYSIDQDTSITISLTPVSYRMVVYVRDAITLQVLPGATITFGESTFTTSGLGKVNIVMPFGVNAVWVDASNYFHSADTILVSEQGAVDLFTKKEFAKVNFSIRLDGSYLVNATVKLGDKSLKTSSTGLAKFDSLRVETELKYAISKDDKLWLEDSASFYSDTTLNIYLTSTALSAKRADEIAVYPNPVQKLLYVKGITDEVKYSLLSLSGITLKQGTLHPSQSIDTSELPPGMYFLELSGQSEAVIIAFQKIDQ